MQINLKRLDDAFHFEASNEDGRTVHLDAAEAIGGHNKGMRPMQLLLAAIGSCSVFDMLIILKKQRQDVKDVQISVHGDREKDAIPSPFTDIQMHFTFFGDLDEEKVKKAVQMGVEKYCSVGAMLEKTAKITYTYQIKPYIA
jgi:putative redox protein